MAPRLTKLAVARRIVRRVWGHPGNAGFPLAAVLRSVAWQLYKRGTGRSLDVGFPGGFVVRCYPDSNSASSVIYFNRVFDWEEMQFCWRFLRQGDRVLDVGANIGVYTCLFAFLVGPDGHVDTFEPFPRHVARLQENLALNGFAGRVTVHDVALSDGDGTTLFVVDRDVSNRVPTRTDHSARQITVGLRRLDSVIGHEQEIAFAKLDVEGLECAVLRGATLLGSAAPAVWVFESNEGLLQKRGTSFAELSGLFTVAGYSLWGYDVALNELQAIDRARPNLFAIRHDSMPFVRARLASGPRMPADARWFPGVIQTLG